MSGIEVARQVKETGQCHLFRAKKDSPNQYNIKPIFVGNNHGWTLLDLFTASHILAVWEALSETNRAKFESLNLLRMSDVAFRVTA